MSDERQEQSEPAPEPEKGQSPAGTEWPTVNMTTDSRPEGNISINSEDGAGKQ